MSVQALLRRVPASFWRFGLVGVGGLFVDMAVLYAVIWGFGLGPVSAKVISFLAAATFTWWMNRRYTFGHSGKALLHEWASFLATNAFGGVVNFSVYTVLVTQFPHPWMPALATAAGSVSGLMFNYLGSRHIVFKPKTNPANQVHTNAISSATVKSVFSWGLCLGSSMAVFLAPALWNHHALTFHDTGGYVYPALEMNLSQGRSLFYGLFLRATSLGWLSFWGPVLAQSLLTLWLIRLVLRCHDLPAGPLATAAFSIGLGLLTGISWYTSQLMPDVLVPLVVLALWLMAFRWQKLGVGERIGLATITLLGLLSHMSCLALAIGLVGIILIARLFLTRRATSLSVFVLAPVAVLLASLILMPALHLALVGKAVFTPGGSSFLFGRLVQDGIAQRWLAEHCPVPGIKLCDLQDAIPHTADDFLWGETSPFQTIGGFGGADAELSQLIKECLKAYPGTLLSTSLRSTAQQLAKVATGDGLGEYHFNSRWIFTDRLPPHLTEPFLAARQQHQQITPALFDGLNIVHVPIAYLSILGLLLIVPWGLRAKRHDLAGIALFMLLALLGNAFICGALSNPHDRYQSRLVWPATLIIGMAVLATRQWRPARRDP